MSDITDITGQIAAYAASAPGCAPPEPVAPRARLHLLDTVAAMISGTRLAAGRAALTYAEGLGAGPASLPGTSRTLGTVDAALVGGHVRACRRD